MHLLNLSFVLILFSFSYSAVADIWEGYNDRPEECDAIEAIAKTSVDMVKALVTVRQISEAQAKSAPYIKSIEEEFKKVDGKPLMADLKAHFEKIKDVTNATCDMPSWGVIFGRNRKVTCFFKNFGEFGQKAYGIHQQHCK